LAGAASPAKEGASEAFCSLEFDKIRTILGGFCLTPTGMERVAALAPLHETGEVVAALEEVTEMVTLIGEKGLPPLGGAGDLKPHLGRLKAEGSFLDADALHQVLSALETAADARRYFLDEEDAPRLAYKGERLVELPRLAQAIRRSVGPRGEILDTASDELAEIRRNIRTVRERIKRALEEMLSSERLAGVFQDRLVTERGGRYVVPVKADCRGRVKGFVHDESGSGQTLFIEPATVLDRNNELQASLRLEKREEERILRALSASVRGEREIILVNQEVMGELDLALASGRFSLLCRGVAPEIADEPLIEIRRARHPLLLVNLDGTPRDGGAVPVDLILGEGADTLIISGPNTGGKTVALKTFGLLVLMVKAGLHIPCAVGSRLYLFGKLFADIGDDQSIEENLSTFSGHLKRIVNILDGADDASLVLLDEAGTGTDPAEGGALVLALLDVLRGRGARVVVTTHLNLIKGYGELQRGVLNAAVEFDEKTLMPTYRLHYGIPGASNAFTIARRFGLPEVVLEKASAYLDRGEREGLDLIERLNRLRADLERQKEEALRLRQEALQERQKRKRLLDEIEQKRGTILEKARKRGERIVGETERRAKTILAEAAESSGDARQRARIVGRVKEIREALPDLPAAPQKRVAPPREAKVGEILRIPALNAEGEVTRLLDGEVELSVRGKKLRLRLKELAPFSPRRFAAQKRAKGSVRGSIEREGFEPKLMLVGQRVDEALIRLDRFLDDALLHDIRELEVVHGSGEGILRKVVREFLSNHRAVTSFHVGDVAQGGDNVTIVKLGD